jgi:hypothetical protein
VTARNELYIKNISAADNGCYHVNKRNTGNILVGFYYLSDYLIDTNKENEQNEEAEETLAF